MLKLKTLALLICFILCNLNQGIHSLKVIAQWERTYPSSVVLDRISNGMLIVGFQNSTVILDTYNPFNGSFVRKICHDILPSGAEGSNITPMSVLGNGKIVINPEFSETIRSRDTFIIFDPLDCSIVKTFKVSEFKQRYKLLVPYYDSFDVFNRFWHNNTSHEINQIMPLRFHNNGENIEANLTFKAHQNLDIGIDELIIFRLIPIKYMDPSEGYFSQIFLKKDQRYFAKLQRFNSQFEPVNKIFVNVDMEVAPSYDRIINCDIKIRNQTCEILDLYLNIERRVVIPDPYPKPIEPISKRPPVPLLWSDGGFVVVHYVYKNDSVHVFLKDVSFDGSTEVFKLGSFSQSLILHVALMFRDNILCVILQDDSRTKKNDLKYLVDVYCVQKPK